jgi:tetratricopeptide (TPR) repeat protein
VRLAKRLVVIAVGLVLTATPSVHTAWANVRSQALYARGLIPFDRGQWEQAYALFDRAVAADANDAVARYYRGLTRARLKQYAAAIQDMEQALQLNPALPHAALDLGITYFDDGQYTPAKTWLERAYQQGVERFTAAFFLGLTCYRMGDDAAAQKYLTEAEADPDLRPSAQYYAGLALFRQGKTEAARAEMQQVMRERPQSDIGKAAQGAVSGAGLPPTRGPAAPQKPWSLYGEVGFQYDTNVVLAPSDAGVKVAEGISKQADGRAVIGLGGAYQLLKTDVGSLNAEYDFYQSIHFHLTEFDLQGHRLRLDALSPPGKVSYGLSALYDFYALDYQSFFQEGLGTPWISLNESDTAATQAYYTFRGRNFFRQPYDPARNGMNNAVGIRQYLNLGTLGPGDWLLDLGYQFDSEITFSNSLGARDFQNIGNQADIDLHVPLYWLVQLQLAYLFRLEDYQYPNSRTKPPPPSPPSGGFRRHDAEQQFAVALRRSLTANVSAEIDYFGVINNSNISNFEYDRGIVAGSVRVTF